MKFALFALLSLTACASLEAPSVLKSASPSTELQVRDLGALSLGKTWSGDLYRSKGVVRKSGYVEDLPMRGRAALGSPIQSFVAPRILSENRVLVGLLGEGVQMRDIRTGAVLWSYLRPIGVGSEPLLVEPYVYVASMNSEVAKLRLDTGEVLWTQKLNVESTGGLAMDAGLVFVTTADNAVWALDEKTGNPVWTYRRPSPTGSVYWSLRGSSKPVLSVDGRFVFAGFSDGSIVSIGSKTGSLSWERVVVPRSNLLKDTDLGPLLSPSGNVLYVGQVDGDLMAISAADGGVLWKRALQVVSAPSFDAEEKALFVSSLSGELHLIRASDASVIWTVSHPSYGLASRAVPVGKDRVAVTWSAGPLTLLDAKSGRTLWMSDDKLQTVAPAASDGARLFVLSSRNELYRFLIEEKTSTDL